MASRIATRPHWWFWGISVLSLLWNSGGPIDYVMTKSRSAAYLAATTPEQRAWFSSFPWWMETAWAFGVWGAIAGSVLLLLRSALAVPVFALSLAGLIVSTIYQYGIGDMPASLRTHAGMAFTTILWMVAAALLWFALRMRARGVLR